MPYRIQINGEFNGHIERTGCYNVSEETRVAAGLPATRKEFDALNEDQIAELQEKVMEVVRKNFKFGGYLYVARLAWWSGRERTIHNKTI